jgi:hypothetical protein
MSIPMNNPDISERAFACACGAVLEVPLTLLEGESIYRLLAEQEGWGFIGRQALCPTHV